MSKQLKEKWNEYADDRLQDNHDNSHLIHELQCHQLELEMQNLELRSMHDRLDESRRHYVELYNFAPVSYCSVDVRGVITEANMAAARLFNTTRRKLLGRPLVAAAGLADGDKTTYRDHLAASQQSSGGATTELNCHLKSRRHEVIVQLLTMAVRDVDGCLIGYRIALTDVSAQKRMEQRQRFLLQTTDALSQTLDSTQTFAMIPHLVVPSMADVCFVDVSDEHGGRLRVVKGFTHADEQARCEAVGGPPEGMLGQFSALSEPSHARSRAGILVRQTADLTKHVGALADSPYGRCMTALGMSSLIAVPIVMADNTLIGVVTLISTDSCTAYENDDLIFAQDLVRRVALALDNARHYEKARQEINTRESFLAAVSHDLRNPLSVIALQAQAMVVSKAPSSLESQQLRGQRIGNAATRMERLIEDLLDMASIEAGQLSIRSQPHDAGRLLEEALDNMSEQIGNKSLQVSASLEALQVLCDKERIFQVLSNLLSNAVKFMEPAGRLRVAVRRAEAFAVFSVADTGPGIPPQELPHVFMRFWQAPKTAKLGTGLGLCIARGIIEASGGTIWVDSELGAGSTFCFTLPMAPAPRDTASLAQLPRLLVVDDDDEMRCVVSDIVEEAGYAVSTATNGKEALQCLGAGLCPSLILLDVQMPVMNGWDFLAERQRSQKLQDIPVVVVSSENTVKTRAAALKADYLAKPVSRQGLLEKIAQALQREDGPGRFRGAAETELAQ